MPSSVANMYYVIAVMIYARVKPSEGSAAITKAHSRPWEATVGLSLPFDKRYTLPLTG